MGYTLAWGDRLLRPVVIAGNWKMHKTRPEAAAFLRQFHGLVGSWADRQVVLCVPYTALATVVDLLKGELAALPVAMAVGAQNVHWAEQGAFTGEIAAAMLTEIGARYTIVGHSERREWFGETDETVNRRLLAAQRGGLIPIVCVGETKGIREQGQTETWIRSQLDRGLVDVDLGRLVIAYEPIWAIGTGDTCAATEANRVIALIREHIGGEQVPILYGGSVKASNIDELMAQPEIDGVLVGGASLDPQEFARIVGFQPLSS
ncbi:MAG: triose-phosphate isomerase [Thermostichales cyanobacterium SZTDM-1c_bins_54]